MRAKHLLRSINRNVSNTLFSLTARARRQQVFWIFATPRTGSYWLSNALNETGKFSIGGEALNPDSSGGIGFGRTQEACRRHLEKSVYSRRGEYVGAKLMLNQMKKHGITASDIKEWFPRSKGVLLYRFDLLAQYVSHERAMSNGQWKSTKKGSKSQVKPVRVEPKEFLNWVRSIEKIYNEAIQSWVGLADRTVAYEEVKMHSGDLVHRLLSERPPSAVGNNDRAIKTDFNISINVVNSEEVEDLCGRSRYLQFRNNTFLAD